MASSSLSRAVLALACTGAVILVGLSLAESVSLILESAFDHVLADFHADFKSASNEQGSLRSFHVGAPASADSSQVLPSRLPGNLDMVLVKEEEAQGSNVLPVELENAVTTVPSHGSKFLSSSSGDDDTLLLVGGIDGTLTAFGKNAGVPLWSFDTAAHQQGPLVSSSLSRIELVRNGMQVQLIPALDGSLFSFDGQKMDLLPVSADTLLSSSFRISEDSVVAGGKETFVYGIHPVTGKVKYSCGVGGCKAQKAAAEEEPSVGTLMVSRLSQTVRAFDVHNGVERWNFSVGSLDMAFAGLPPPDGDLQQQQPCHLVDNDHMQFHFDVASGMVVAATQQEELWRYQMKEAITGAWTVSRLGCVRVLPLMTEIPPLYNPLLSSSKHNQLIYIGSYHDQLYVQRANSPAALKHVPPARTYPHVTFRPLLINAPSRTPSIFDAYRAMVADNFPLRPSESDPNKALVPIGPNEYPFEGGYYVAWEDGSKSQPFRLTDEDSNNEESSLGRIVRKWKELTGLMVLPVVVYLGWRAYNEQMRQEPMKKKSESASGSLQSLQSVISIQQMQAPKHSRFESDFEVVDRVGKGGFGKVFMARNRLDESLYAVKQISLPRSEAAREKVRREVRVLAKLEHVGIVRFFNAWVETETEPEPAKEDSGVQLEREEEPGSVTGSYTDLRLQWIGTRRNRPVKLLKSVSESGGRGDLSDSLRLIPADLDDDSDVVFEAGSGLAVEASDTSPSGRRRRRSSRSSASKKSSPSLSGLMDLEDDTQMEDAELSPTSTQNSPTKAPRGRAQLFIQMELCRRETLRDWLRLNSSCELRIRQHVLDIYHQIVCAVDYLHSRGLMHRDLKPSNILFSLDATAVKLADFGLVTSLEEGLDGPGLEREENYLSIHGHTNQVGTSLYMSPEVLRGDSYDEKVDMYSLGLILLELLVPFGTEMERVRSMTEARTLKLRCVEETPCSQPEDLGLLKQLLSQDPKQRPSAAELRRCEIFNGLTPQPEDGIRGRGHSFSVPAFFQTASTR